MYAIFEAKGKQFRATPDRTLRIPSLAAEPGERVTFDTVLLAQKSAGEDVMVGRPALKGASVACEIVRHGREDKIVVYKMKRRKGYRRKQGHRQKFTEVKVVEIDLGTGKPAKEKAEKPKAEKPKTAGAEETPVAQPPEQPESVEVVDAARVAEGDAGAMDADAVDATPAAVELAQDEGIDLASIEGSGKEGRILKSDVEAAIREREGE